MKKRVRQALLRIRLLQEEFSKKELADAVEILSEGDAEHLLDYLKTKKSTGNTNADKSSRPLAKRSSRVVEELRSKDPERHAILAEFESMLQQGMLLPTMSDLRRLGTTVSKDFQAGKSRKETILRLMRVLAPMPLEPMKRMIREVTDQQGGAPEADSSYGRLARYLMGRPDGID